MGPSKDRTTCMRQQPFKTFTQLIIHVVFYLLLSALMLCNITKAPFLLLLFSVTQSKFSILGRTQSHSKILIWGFALHQYFKTYSLYVPLTVKGIQLIFNSLDRISPLNRNTCDAYKFGTPQDINHPSVGHSWSEKAFFLLVHVFLLACYLSFGRTSDCTMYILRSESFLETTPALPTNGRVHPSGFPPLKDSHVQKGL